jgi:hypothetical protein
VDQICLAGVDPSQVADAVDGLSLERSDRQEVIG